MGDERSVEGEEAQSERDGQNEGDVDKVREEREEEEPKGF